ncbi:MAG: hypothetical protein JSU08_08585 [Acidobacteria bacterium]|nr:hypothetical protein [Acidobacteriota bacterium]
MNPTITIVRVLACAGLLLACGPAAFAQVDDAASPPPNTLTATLSTAPLQTFPGPTDSNTPLVWIGDRLTVFSSQSGRTTRATGSSLDDAAMPEDAEPGMAYTDDIGSGRWLEAVIRDDETGRLYGWYHNEIPTDCPQGIRLWPQIGAAISDDDGATWDDLGIILTPREGTVSCDTEHPMTDGGIGDFSVILDNNEDPTQRFVYFLFSSYGGDLEEQGISFARMRWIDRDHPLDRFSGESAAFKWDGQDWVAPGIGGRSVAIFHDAEQVTWTSIANNGYWGPSVHWNVDLQRFIVLMSRSRGGNYESAGIFMTYTTTLDDPRSWAQPKVVIGDSQGWYPQVVGDPSIQGTDKLGGQHVRYFNQGQSRFFIDFSVDAPIDAASELR